MSTNNAKFLLYQHVSKLREKLHVTFDSYPLQLPDLCSGRPVQIQRHSFQTVGFCALAFIGEKFDTIVLNANRTQLEQNFDCGHELIHLTKHRNLKMDCFNCFDKTQPAQNPFVEWEANEGAAELLVPYQQFIPAFYETSCQHCRETAKIIPTLAGRFQVTPAVIEYRVRSLQYEIYQYVVLHIPIEGLSLHSLHALKRAHLSHLSAFSYYCPNCLTPWDEPPASCPHCGAELQSPLYGIGYRHENQISVSSKVSN